MKRQKRYRYSNKLKGLCIECTKPVEDGKLRCEYHLDKQRRKAADRRAARKLRELC